LILNNNHALWKAKGKNMATILGLRELGEAFGLAEALVSRYPIFYVLTSGHNEIALILSTAIVLGMSLIGIALPLSCGIIDSGGLMHMLVWGGVVSLARIIIYGLVRPVLPDLPRSIRAGEATAARGTAA
jgi:uncharacterized membrane protein YjfL (UPF0719 family)